MFLIGGRFRNGSVGRQGCRLLLCSHRTGKQPSLVVLQCLVCLGSGPACGFPFCDGISLDILAKRSLSINWEIAAQADASCVSVSCPPASYWADVARVTPSTLQPVAGLPGLPSPPPLHVAESQFTSFFPPGGRHNFWKNPKPLIFLLPWQDT